MGIGRRLVKLVVLGRERGYRARLLKRLGLRRSGEEQGRPEASPAAAHVPPRGASGALGGWHPVVQADELPSGTVTEVIPQGTALAVAHLDEGFYAVDNVCPHAGGPLGEGELDEHELVCPYHGYAYDVRDGSCLTDEDLAIRTFPAEQRGVHVCVCLDSDGC